ncbi:MAG: hypothetical protein JW742_07455 [Candidatus Aminicenantes bacterium]|nr:hypothetical protein [Candidatus Aminicenantes bacterium]
MGVSCSRCKKPLRVVDIAREGFIVYEGDHSQLPTLYSGVICTRCGRVECTSCRLGGISRPCFWCGGRIEPAYDHAVRRYRGTMPPMSRLLKNVGLVVLAVLAALVVQRILSPRRPAAAGAAARVAEVGEMTDPESLSEVARDAREPVAARVAAVLRIEDDDMLDETARNEEAPVEVRAAAVRGIAGQDVLAALALDAELDPAVRGEAIKRLNDSRILRTLAAGASDYRNIQKAAQDRLRRLASD